MSQLTQPVWPVTMRAPDHWSILINRSSIQRTSATCPASTISVPVRQHYPSKYYSKIRADIPDWSGTGMSVMEVSHRGKRFCGNVAARAEQDLRDLLQISGQLQRTFSAGWCDSTVCDGAAQPVADPGQTADYLLTGSWSKKAVAEARKFCAPSTLSADSSDGKILPAIPDRPTAGSSATSAAYVHYTANETIAGVEFHVCAGTSVTLPLVTDMSSTILSRPIDVQPVWRHLRRAHRKTSGRPGLRSLSCAMTCLTMHAPTAPTLLTYKAYAESDSMTNTPPTFAWYVAGLVFDYLKRNGGLAAMADINERKASMLYAAIDASEMYSNPVNVQTAGRG